MNDTPEPVPRPSGVAAFCDLASALFALEETGGPLHVHLDDHNTELLVGDESRNTTAARPTETRPEYQNEPEGA